VICRNRQALFPPRQQAVFIYFSAIFPYDYLQETTKKKLKQGDQTMTLLGQAFALAGSCHHTISQTCNFLHDTYDRMGCAVWRAMMDDQYLSLQTTAQDSKAYRETASLYDWGKKQVASWVYETLAEKGASGDVGPKPDIKPGLMNVAQATVQTAGPYLARVNWTSPLMIGALCLTAAFAYAITHTGTSHGMAVDTLATIYGSKPSAPQPTND